MEKQYNDYFNFIDVDDGWVDDANEFHVTKEIIQPTHIPLSRTGNYTHSSTEFSKISKIIKQYKYNKIINSIYNYNNIIEIIIPYIIYLTRQLYKNVKLKSHTSTFIYYKNNSDVLIFRDNKLQTLILLLNKCRCNKLKLELDLKKYY